MRSTSLGKWWIKSYDNGIKLVTNHNELKESRVNRKDSFTLIVVRDGLQSCLIGDTLQDIKFNLAITSDMKRPIKMAENIMKKNNSITKLKYWHVLRDRWMENFQGDLRSYISLWTIDDSLKERENKARI